MFRFCGGLAPSLGVLVIFRILQGIGRWRFAAESSKRMSTTRFRWKARHGVCRLRPPVLWRQRWTVAGRWITGQLSWDGFLHNVPVGIRVDAADELFVSDPVHEESECGEEPDPRIDYIGIGLSAWVWGHADNSGHRATRGLAVVDFIRLFFSH